MCVLVGVCICEARGVENRVENLPPQRLNTTKSLKQRLVSNKVDRDYACNTRERNGVISHTP